MNKKPIGKNQPLHHARRQKKDEFYTLLSDIENELHHYRQHFRAKTVYCNCDDPQSSNFFKYFSLKFRSLKLKSLITTCYKNQNHDLFSQHVAKSSVGLICSPSSDSSMPAAHDTEVFHMEGDGDFRSAEAIDLLKQSDIVVTNPPFSLFRDYVAQLIEHKKKFLIIGSMNAVTYKEIFPLIKNNLMWLGITPNGRDMLFDVPEHYAQTMVETGTEGSTYKIKDGKVYGRLGNAAWFTNLEHTHRREELILYRRYSKAEYPNYDDSEVINVNKTADIPLDWEGPMGVPITFLNHYNPDQFKILGMANSARWIDYECYTILKGNNKYNRVIVQRK